MDAVGLHHVEERLLANPILLLEELVLGVRPGDVPSDDLTDTMSHHKMQTKNLAEDIKIFLQLVVAVGTDQVTKSGRPF